MTISRRDFLKGTAGAVGAAAVTSPAAALGQSDSSVMDYIRSNFRYDSNNRYFTDEAVERAKDALDRKASAARETLDAFQEFTALSQLRADDLISLDAMIPGTGTTADAMERIYNQLGTTLPEEMMQEWLTNHLFNNDRYPVQQSRAEWYNPPNQLAANVEEINVQYVYPDLLDLAFWKMPRRSIRPRPVSIDPAYVEEIEQRVQQGQNGLQAEDQPLLGRRYLYEYLLTSGQEDLLFNRQPLEDTYQEIMWHRQHQIRNDRAEEIQKARELGVHASSGIYNQVVSQLSSTALAYIHLSDQLITPETLGELKDHIEGDLADTTTEWGGRVMIQDGRLHFQKDPLRKKTDNESVHWDSPFYVAADFSRWHSHTIDSLAMSERAGPSHLDLQANASRGLPEFVVTPLGKQGDKLALNIDLFQTTGSCRRYTSTGQCPWPTRDEIGRFVVDLGIFEA